jgi:hypothetical protein
MMDVSFDHENKPGACQWMRRAPRPATGPFDDLIAERTRANRKEIAVWEIVRPGVYPLTLAKGRSTTEASQGEA